MANLSETISAVKGVLGTATAVTDWDYWGVAPDPSFSSVGSVWPIAVTPGTVGKSPTQELQCTAALWRGTPEALEASIADFVGSVTAVFGDNSPCPSGLGSLGLSSSLGTLTIGLPSTSAASSTGNLSGIWAAVSFTLSIR